MQAKKFFVLICANDHLFTVIEVKRIRTSIKCLIRITKYTDTNYYDEIEFFGNKAWLTLSDLITTTSRPTLLLTTAFVSVLDQSGNVIKKHQTINIHKTFTTNVHLNTFHTCSPGKPRSPRSPFSPRPGGPGKPCEPGSPFSPLRPYMQLVTYIHHIIYIHTFEPFKHRFMLRRY